MEELNREIATISDAWAKKYLANRLAYLKRRNVLATGELEHSFGYEVDDNPTDAAVRAMIAFADHGRIIDMRRIDHDKWGRNAVERLEKWILKKGINAFVPGFLKKYGLKAPPRDVVNRIAWGIMVERGKGKFRRRPWYAKSKTAAVTELYNEVAAASLDNTSETLTQQFDAKAYARAKGRE